ncbi:MAG TPA: DUF885 domain-containing protein [Acidimicrobiia bacterium]|jgi:uncharacterized protein (DUF885 family)|nr:DUF885 domain-containing protein [Acidimicrobiia bacterium]
MTTPFALSSRYIDDLLELDPLFATSLGVREHAGEWGDTGLSGAAAKADLAARYRADLQRHLDHPDSRERLAAHVLVAELGELVEEFEHGDHLTDLSHMASSFHWYTRVFDLMPKDTVSDWSPIVMRLATIDRAYSGLQERLEAGRAAGHVVARRQVESVVAQAKRLSAAGGALDLLLRDAPPEVQDTALDAVMKARAAIQQFGQWLERTYGPDAKHEDAAGEPRYRRRASRFVGIEVEPLEAYEWGWGEFHRLVAEMERVATDIVPEGGLLAATELLERDPSRAAPSRDSFLEFIEARQELALAELDGSHFDVAPPLRTITVNLAPPGSPLGAYYLRPSEDFSRPGGIWYSVGDQEVFPLYHHVSTAYHEGFPGHHLQVGTAMANADRISRAHRLAVWYPGYGEGWALYSELLMQELGYFEIPDFHFGMLAKHLYRATRIVIDVGLHLGLTIPEHAPVGAGEPWSFDLATQYLRRFGFRTPDQSVAETLRYLGWPGQAIAYKLGEREILSLRREARTSLGDQFDLKQFHDRVIGHGAMRFDLLRRIVLHGSV